MNLSDFNNANLAEYAIFRSHSICLSQIIIAQKNPYDDKSRFLRLIEDDKRAIVAIANELIRRNENGSAH